MGTGAQYLLKGVSLALLAALSLSGCGKKEEATESAQPASISHPSPLDARGDAGAVPANRQTLTILPEAPTTADPLMAIFRATSGRIDYRWEKNGQTIPDEERNRLAAAHFARGDVVTVIVENNGETFRADSVIGNTPPVVLDVSFENPAIHRGVDIELIATGADDDGDDVGFLFRWYVNGEEVDFIDGPTLPGNRFHRGDSIHFVVTPYDDQDEGIPYEGSPFVIPNAPPFFVSTPPLDFSGDSYSYQARAEDPDGDEVSYALENPPPGMTIHGRSGQIDWRLEDLPDGAYHIVIVAIDSQGQKGYQEYTMTVVRR